MIAIQRLWLLRINLPMMTNASHACKVGPQDRFLFLTSVGFQWIWNKYVELVNRVKTALVYKPTNKIGVQHLV